MQLHADRNRCTVRLKKPLLVLLQYSPSLIDSISARDRYFIILLAFQEAFGMYRIKCKLRPLMTTNHAEVLIKQNKPSKSPACLASEATSKAN
jgi:hypothetical protein